jgi:predicted Ser/Thr protein kinase
MPDVALADLERGRIDFKQIQIEKELGRGAFGIIYRGVWKGEHVAVKQ